MRLFLDTEFTNLVPDNKLISIALVDDNGEYFYAELTDTYTVNDCSDFVKEIVLPILKGGEYRMSSYDCCLKLGHWIEERGSCILACDNPGWDIPHLKFILRDLWPENLKRNTIYQVYVPYDLETQIVIENNYDVHNALDDALVMMKATHLKEQQK